MALLSGFYCNYNFSLTSDSDNIKEESQIIAPVISDEKITINGESAANELPENGPVQPDTLQQETMDIMNGITPVVNHTTDPIQQSG